ncbi:SHUGOSHIN 1-like protein [Drosera capensis]
MIELHRLRMELQQLRLQNLLFAQDKSQMSAELRAGNDKLKVLEHELQCVRNVLLTRKLEFQEIAKARRLHQQASARETGESLQVDKDDDNKPCSPKEIDQSKVAETSTVKHVQTKEKNGNRRRQSSRFKMEELESTKDVVKATEVHKPVDRRLSLRRQSLCLKTERVESNKGKLDMDDYVLPECPVQIDAEFPVGPEPNDGKHDDILITSASTVPETDIVEANINACISASGWTDLIGRPTRKAAQNVQSYKETRINSKMRRPD